MDIKHSTIEISEEDPFAKCILERKKYADILTEIVDSYAYGFVLGINNKWGTGKTTFVKMWEQELKNNGHETVYFNAWENDFEDNALIALMGELKTLTKKSTEQEFNSTLKMAASLTKHVAPYLILALAEKYIDTKSIKDVIEGVTKGLSDIFEKEVNKYAERKKCIIEFKKSLSEFIANTYKGKPVVFIVDELDRCRPNYAVSVLEQIKHFFSVPNVVFVLSIDKMQLGNAIKGVYGSEAIDSEEYLRKFIDLEYSLPEPDTNTFHKYLFKHHNFEEFFNSTERQQYRELQKDGEFFLRVSKLLFTNRNISLRQQEKIFTIAKVALRSFNANNYVIPHIFLFLAFVKITDNKFYNALRLKELTLLEVQEKYRKAVVRNINEETENELMWLEAYLIIYYNNFISSKYYSAKLYKHDIKTNSNKLLIDSIINKEKNTTFLDIIVSICKTRDEGDMELGYFLNHIELLEDLKT